MNPMKDIAIPMIAALVSSLFFFSAKAYDGVFADGTCKIPTTVFYYINGILTSYKDADKAREALEEEWGKNPANNREFKLSYNQTHGLFRDILKTFRLKSKEDNEDKTFWKLLSGEKPGSLNVDALSKTMASEIASRLPQIQPGGASDEEHLIHAERFRRDLEKGKKVIVVAHSQGGLIANAAVQSLWDERWDYLNYIDKINIAFPSSLYNKRGNGSLYPIQYITAEDDRVINALRFLAPNTLRGNVDNDPGIFNDHRDWLNHGFLPSYYSNVLGSPRLWSRWSINNMIQSRFLYMAFPWKEKSEYPITISVHRDRPRKASHAAVWLIINSAIKSVRSSSIYVSYFLDRGYNDLDSDPVLKNPETVTLPCIQNLDYDTHYRVGIYLTDNTHTRKNFYPYLKNVQIDIVVGDTKKVFSIDHPLEHLNDVFGDPLASITVRRNNEKGIEYTIEETMEDYLREFVTVKTFSIGSSSAPQKFERPVLAYQARIHAIPPPAARDRALIRVRCEDREQDCKLWLECTTPKEDRVFSGWVSKAIPARGSIALDARKIADSVGDWSGKGRLACDIGSARKFSAQLWIRSDDGMLVNTGAFAQSRRFAYTEGDRYRRYEGVDIDSIPAPGGDDESNLRIRCAGNEECTNTRLECAEDDGTLHEATLGTIPVARVRHLQSEELAELIDHRWEGLGLSCEVQSDGSITVQALTRTAGILVNNGASNDEP
ncbi:hypothetical protein [Thioalkalivibrio sp. HK1]|uniref:hypothetical protein n=1 Tax=Thioalkalivibrio sp. HK1 TaxID=1469245 RepID=UPI0012DE5024|nr:hypothetical protein [Thioalkalivibrio sp. HK1]